MPITSTITTTVPAASGNDPIAVGLAIQPKYTPAGVSASVQMTRQTYRLDGTGKPVKIGDVQVTQIPDVFAAAATDAALATALTAIEAAIQAYVTAKGL